MIEILLYGVVFLISSIVGALVAADVKPYKSKYNTYLSTSTTNTLGACA